MKYFLFLFALSVFHVEDIKNTTNFDTFIIRIENQYGRNVVPGYASQVISNHIRLKTMVSCP